MRNCCYGGSRNFAALQRNGLHDCWSPYWKFDKAAHQLCCAHLLRELNGVTENHPEQTWAKSFSTLLLKMKKAKDKAIEKGKTELSYANVHRYKTQYDGLISLAYLENPAPVTEKGKRGKKEKRKSIMPY